MSGWETLFFFVFSVGAAFFSAMTVFFRNPLYSALSLIVNFFCFAGLYVLLSAHFMAVTQVLVYGGAIMVLFVFIIMLLNLTEDELPEFELRLHHGLAAVVSLAMFGFMLSALLPLADLDQVKQRREAWQGQIAKAQQEAGEDVVVLEPALATKSRVPGLYADLNEVALDEGFEGQIRSWDKGETTPATGKYRPFRADKKFTVPPVLKQSLEEKQPHASAVVVNPQAKGNFGTVEPLSLQLVNRFVVPFELAAVLLLAAIIGAVIIAKRRV